MEDSTPGEVQQEQQRVPFAAGEREMRVARQPPGARGAAQHGFGHGRQDALDQPVPERRDAGGFLREFRGNGLGGRGKRGDRGGVQRPGADVAFLPPAVLDRGQLHRPAQDQRADADRSADLVPGDGHGVQARSRGSPRARSRRPGRRRSGRVRRRRVPVPRLRATGWMVPTSLLAHMTRDQGDRPGSRDSSASSTARSTTPVGIHRQPAHFGALVPFEPFDGVQHRVVFDGGAQDAGAGRVLGTPGPVQALDGKVVRLGPAGGEDDFRGVRPGGRRQHFAARPRRRAGRGGPIRAARTGCRSGPVRASARPAPPGRGWWWRHDQGRQAQANSTCGPGRAAPGVHSSGESAPLPCPGHLVLVRQFRRRTGRRASMTPLDLTFWRWSLAAVPLLLLAHFIEKPDWRRGAAPLAGASAAECPGHERLHAAALRRARPTRPR